MNDIYDKLSYGENYSDIFPEDSVMLPNVQQGYYHGRVTKVINKHFDEIKNQCVLNTFKSFF